ncbi:hypothetical protein HUN59_18185 [Curtobacterium sp. Csp2]|uniref:hypothetical protein n=1 Tax=Curtobacterium sp. Csp2 TaxID=2495430 RepID=UPI0015805D16|nr:hypothetical protein [Curtobacterium sp. Csp2]QKS17891.1 hypothetical protein HUN59_18185 [Curtobacterium sp. Csp2]
MFTLQVLAAGSPAASVPLWPTLLAGAAAGAIITSLVTLLAGALEARREHRRWLREKRLDAYLRAFALTKGFDLNSSKTGKVVASLIAEAVAEGPEDLDAKAAFERLRQDPDYRALDEQASELQATAARELAAVVLLGPQEVAVAVLEMQKSYEAGDDERAGRAEQDFRDAAQRVLRVPRPRRRRR